METINSDAQAVEHKMISLLEYIGEDVTREGLIETPARYVKFLEEFTRPVKLKMTTFDVETYDEMIIQSNIPFYSLCEHHVLPFFGKGFIAYIPKKKIIGLSKLARILDKYSRRLQNQERITTQTAEFIQEHLDPLGVAVVLKARHLCMEMRGVMKHDTWNTTSRLIGIFKTDVKARNEFMGFVR